MNYTGTYWTIYCLNDIKTELSLVSEHFTSYYRALAWLANTNTPKTPDIVITSLSHNEAIKQYVSYSRDF